MKKNILLNLSCLCVLFGSICFTEDINGAQGKQNRIAMGVARSAFEQRNVQQLIKSGVVKKDAVSGKITLDETKAKNVLGADYFNKNKETFLTALDGLNKDKNDKGNPHPSKPNLIGFDAIKGSVKIMIGNKKYTLASLENGDTTGAQFQSEQEKCDAIAALDKLINNNETYSTSCIENVRKCKASLPEVKQEEEQRGEETEDMEHQGDNGQNVLNVDIDGIVKTLEIQAGEKNLNNYLVEAEQQMSVFLLKGVYNGTQIKEEDEAAVIMHMAIIKGEACNLYVKRTASAERLREDGSLSLFPYGANTSTKLAFGVQGKTFEARGSITIKEGQLFPDAVMENYSISAETACNYMKEKFTERYLNAYELSDEAKKKIENQTTLNGKLEALGLAEKTN